MDVEPKPEKSEPKPEKSEPKLEKSEPKPEKSEPKPEKSEPKPEKSEPKPETPEPKLEKSESDGPFYYPNRMGRILLQAMRKELGRERMQEVLRDAGQAHLTTSLLPNNLDRVFSFDRVAAIQAATEKVFGTRAVLQINYRVGRSTFEMGLKDFDPMLGIADLPMRLMPLGTKFRVGLDVFARVFNQFSDQRVRLSETETHHLWIIERCPLCWKRTAEEPCCHLAAGLLDEAVFWGTGGRRFKVEEISCMARGDANCTVRIDREPLY